MPVKTIKFLGREKIAAKDIHLTVHRNNEPHVAKVKVDFSTYQFPAGSRVFLDIKQMDTVRFSLGTVASHTNEATFDITHKHGVGLNAIHHEYMVGCKSMLIEMHRKTFCCLADYHRFHTGAYGATHCGFGHSVTS